MISSAFILGGLALLVLFVISDTLHGIRDELKKVREQEWLTTDELKKIKGLLNK